MKAASSVSTRDISGLERLADLCGEEFRGGMVLYNDDDILRLGDDKHMALSLSELWNCRHRRRLAIASTKSGWLATSCNRSTVEVWR